MDDLDDFSLEVNICRVCQLEGTPEQPLFHPCICTGSIKYIHQQCLVQWLQYSRSQYCEICNYKFLFQPIYTPDMLRLSIRNLVAGITSKVLKFLPHYSLVVLAWLCVCFTARWIQCYLLNHSFDAMTLLINMWSKKYNYLTYLYGFFVLNCSLFVYTGLVWLVKIIIADRGLDWFERDEPNNQQQPPIPENPIEEIDGDESGDESNESENDNQVDEDRWIPFHQDDQAEENSIWTCILGLEGYLLFIQFLFILELIHVSCLLFLAFLPHCIGKWTINFLSLHDKIAEPNFEYVIITLWGYCLIGMVLLIIHAFTTIFGYRRSNDIIGIIYIVVKVFLLSVVNFVLLPLTCGWWLDLCSWPMFDISFKDRLASFRLNPYTSVFIYWLVGKLFANFFILICRLLQEVVRPGVLWFLWCLRNPDNSAIQELIQMDMLYHGRRLITSTMALGTTIFLVVWLPITILKLMWPSFLPYNVKLTIDFSDLIFFLLIRFEFPLLFLYYKRGRICYWLKIGLHIWCITVSYLLGIKSYLLGDGDATEAYLEAVREGLLRDGRQVGFCPYTRPTNFALRLIALLVLVFFSVVFISLSVITIPVWAGRMSMSPDVHELYYIIIGIHECWLSVLFIIAIYRIVGWLQEGRAINRLKLWLKIGSKATVALIVCFGFIPLLFGLLVELVVVVPVKVHLHQTPVLLVADIWTYGIICLFISLYITMNGPDWSLKRIILRIRRNGFRRLNLKLIMQYLVTPVIAVLSLSLAVPYVIANSIVPLIVYDESLNLLIARQIYPTLISMIIVTKCLRMRVGQRLDEHIEIYNNLERWRLLNYNQ